MTDKIRVLRVITWLPVGGIERKLVDVLPRLDRARFEVTLVCLRERGPLADELEAAGIRVECVPFRRRWDLRALRSLARLMRERRIDVVHSHMYRSNVPATVAAHWADVPRLWCQIHNVDTWETSRQLAMDRFLCRWRTGMIAVSEEVRRDAIQRLRLPPERVRVIYNGVNLDRFGASTRREALRAAHNAEPQDVVFLFGARMVDQKRPGDFIALARHLLDIEARGASASRAQFWIAGDGPLLESLRTAAAQGPLADRIRFLGRRDDMADVMGAADAFVLPSTKEGFSNALLEAMASGLAIAATDVGGNAEAVRREIDGFIFDAGDIGALCSIGERLAADGDLRRRLGESARERVRRFGLDAMVRQLQALYGEGA